MHTNLEHIQPPILQRKVEYLHTIWQKIKAIEAIGGIILLICAFAAMILANSNYAEAYQQLLHSEISIHIAGYQFGADIHFIINDILMAVFFLVVGIEVRRELHDGALADFKVAFLPIMAACGGVMVPALIYVLLSPPMLQQGWAIPTATDIAFAVGVLALLGRYVPASVRIFLLTLAIIDDIIAVLIIALFYSEGLALAGLMYVFFGASLIILLQKSGVFSLAAYILPSVTIWWGLFEMGIHPSLAGVIVGLMTPVLPRLYQHSPSKQLKQALKQPTTDIQHQPHVYLDTVDAAKKELIAPVARVSYLLSPWVTFFIMPLFAFANAGVYLGAVDMSTLLATQTMLAIAAALVIGKPIGIFFTTWILVRLKLGKLPPEFTYGWLFLLSCLAGIGFTMSIFVANLAFTDVNLLSTAKLGILVGSSIAAILGLCIGVYLIKMNKKRASIQS